MNTTAIPSWRHVRVPLLIVSVLSILTVAVTASPSRYRVMAPDIIENGDFRNGIRPWRAITRAVELLPGPSTVVEMQVLDGKPGWIGRRLSPAGPFDHYRVHVRAAAQDIQGVRYGYQGGRLSVVQIDERGQRLWFMPDRVFRLTGTVPWRSYSAVIPIAKNVHSTWLVVFALGGSGKLQFSDLKVEGVLERPSYNLVIRLVAVAWLAFASWLLLRLLLLPDLDALRLLCLAATLFTIIAATTPQPHLNQALTTASLQLSALVAFIIAQGAPETGRSDATEQSTKAGQGPIEDMAEGATPAADGVTASVGEPALREKAQIDGKRAQRLSRTGPSQRRAPPPLRPPGDTSDKTGHFVAYLVLALLWQLENRRWRWWVTAAGLAALSAVIQIVQCLSVTREADFTDFLHDLAGILTGTLLAALLIVGWRRAAGRTDAR